jgi:hypothetical protein
MLRWKGYIAGLLHHDHQAVGEKLHILQSVLALLRVLRHPRTLDGFPLGGADAPTVASHSWMMSTTRFLDFLRSACENKRGYSVSSHKKDTRQVKDRESKNRPE